MEFQRRRHLLAALVAGLMFPVIFAGFCCRPAEAWGCDNQVAIQSTVRAAMAQVHAKSVIAQVRSNGANVCTLALGESMTGVPATPSMHFRNGAMAFTYMSTMLLELVDRKQVKLSDKLSAFFPTLPYARIISLKNLANMTSGYADYVYQTEVLNETSFHPFRQWTTDELISIGISKPMMFTATTNWGYSHTNYVILAKVLELLTHMPLAQAMQKYIFGPMDLEQTQSSSTPAIPEPVLHTFSSERRGDLGVSAGVPFYEESTFWNPSWTTAEGAVQTTDITDMSKSMEAVGTGKLLSQESKAAQINPNLVGFGHADKTCPVCRKMTVDFNYGLGVVLLGPWITQTKNFAGSAATVGYLPAKRLTIAVQAVLAPEGFDAKGNAKDPSIPLFSALANLLAPNTLPKLP